MPNVSILAVIVAAISAFVLGGLWYSPMLFAKAWQKEAGLSDAQLKSANKPRTFGLTLLLALVSAFVFGLFLGPHPAMALALGAGFSAGLCWVAASIGSSYLFEQKSLKHFLINGGYCTVQFTLYGLVFWLLG